VALEQFQIHRVGKKEKSSHSKQHNLELIPSSSFELTFRAQSQTSSKDLLLDLISLAMAEFFRTKRKGLVHPTLLDLGNLKVKNVK
jgi:hypothetical protein